MIDGGTITRIRTKSAIDGSVTVNGLTAEYRLQSKEGQWNGFYYFDLWDIHIIKILFIKILNSCRAMARSTVTKNELLQIAHHYLTPGATRL